MNGGFLNSINGKSSKTQPAKNIITTTGSLWMDKGEQEVQSSYP